MPEQHLRVQGIKCDAPGCGYRDMSIQLHQYREYLNRPCPQCGANLLTEADMFVVWILVLISAILGALFGPPAADAERVKLEMNGTGSIKVVPK